MGYPTLRADSVITATFNQALSTTPIQISGGSTSLPALGNKAPSTVRQMITVVNHIASTQNIYVGVTNAVASSGASAIKTIAPGQEFTFACDGLLPLWVVAAAAGGVYGVVEFQ